MASSVKIVNRHSRIRMLLPFSTFILIVNIILTDQIFHLTMATVSVVLLHLKEFLDEVFSENPPFFLKIQCLVGKNLESHFGGKVSDIWSSTTGFWSSIHSWENKYDWRFTESFTMLRYFNFQVESPFWRFDYQPLIRPNRTFWGLLEELKSAILGGPKV